MLFINYDFVAITFDFLHIDNCLVKNGILNVHSFVLLIPVLQKFTFVGCNLIQHKFGIL